MIRRPPRSPLFPSTTLFRSALHLDRPAVVDPDFPAAGRHLETERLERSLERSIPDGHVDDQRSEEHTSELQSPCNLVCRLLLEKKKKQSIPSAQNEYDISTYYRFSLLVSESFRFFFFFFF